MNQAGSRFHHGQPVRIDQAVSRCHQGCGQNDEVGLLKHFVERRGSENGLHAPEPAALHLLAHRDQAHAHRRSHL